MEHESVAFHAVQVPYAFDLLGKRLVLWQDGDQQLRCFEDKCPHRLAPLSEGRIHSDGTLMCSYHGWRFQGDGACVDIPQSLNAKANATACASSRSCAKAHPVKVLLAFHLHVTIPYLSPKHAAEDLNLLMICCRMLQSRMA